MIRSASGYGSGRSKTALTMLKIAVFAPMPSASVKIAITLKPGCFRSMRKAYRISWFTSGVETFVAINRVRSPESLPLG